MILLALALALVVIMILFFRQLVRAARPGSRTRVDIVVARMSVQYVFVETNNATKDSTLSTVLATPGSGAVHQSDAVRLINSLVTVPLRSADALSFGGHWGTCLAADASFHDLYYAGVLMLPALMAVAAVLAVASLSMLVRCSSCFGPDLQFRVQAMAQVPKRSAIKVPIRPIAR